MSETVNKQGYRAPHLFLSFCVLDYVGFLYKKVKVSVDVHFGR